MTTLTKIIVSTIMGLLMLSCNFNMNFGPGATGNGNVVTEERNIDQSFDHIEANAGLDVYLTQDGNTSVTVEADENLLDMILTYVEDGILHLTVDGNIKYAKSRTILVSFGNIKSITSTSGSDVYSDGTIKATDLKLTSTSGSDMELDVETENLSLQSTSGSDLKISGTTYKLTADASSGSDIKAQNLVSQICKASASSGADISVNTKKELIANASSGGDIKYTGHPEKVESSDSASGSVRKN